MIKIALVCENGASTGLCVKKMIEASKKMNLEAEIKAYPFSLMDTLVENYDVILLGPQLAFKKTTFLKKYPDYANKIDVVNTMDFGMMNGEKIVKFALAINEKNK